MCGGRRSLAAAPWRRSSNDADAVVNLAGEGIADKTMDARSERRRFSTAASPQRARWQTRFAPVHMPPRIFLSASAVGFYGDPRRRDVDRGVRRPAPTSWRQSADRGRREASAAAGVARVVLLRTGVVLAATAGRCRGWRCRSGSLPAGGSAQAVSTCRGFISTTGSGWCAGRCERRRAADR